MNNIAEIKLTNGGVAIVDAEDAERVERFEWRRHAAGYAVTRVNGRDVFMHRLLMPPPPGKIVDHANGVKLDNRRENLRPATYAQNAINSRTPRTNTSGVRGVRRQKAGGRYRATLGKLYLGHFATFAEAYQARREAEVRLYGEFARLGDE